MDTGTGKWNSTPQGTIDSSQILNHVHSYSGQIPNGVIMWWDLSLGNIPEGWSIYEPLIGRYPRGNRSGSGSLVSPALPNIKGWIDTEAGMQTVNGCFDKSNHGDDGGLWGADSAGKKDCIEFNASWCSSIYKDNHTTVTPPICLVSTNY